jgi:hypothetical protein
LASGAPWLRPLGAGDAPARAPGHLAPAAMCRAGRAHPARRGRLPGSEGHTNVAGNNRAAAVA